MQPEKLFEGVIQRLIGITVHVNLQDISLPRTVERKNPARRTTLGLSFPDPDHASTIGARWQKHAEGSIFSELWQLCFGFAEWYRQTGGI